MIKKLLFIVFLTHSGMAAAQWAVLDQKVLDVVTYINDTSKGSDGKFDAIADQKLHDLKFEAESASNSEKYIGTTADCGDIKLNESHYNACLGLRTLRLITLDQTLAIVMKIRDRKKQIDDVISAGAASNNAGNLQKNQFVLQGLQAKMQNDAMELDALRYGYKQRETMYEMQMAEARRATDTRKPPAAGGVSITLPVPFVR